MNRAVTLVAGSLVLLVATRGVSRAAGRVRMAQASTPSTTLLYQNFPNPFPTATAATTCIWFDLDRPSHVNLAIFDVRGNPVLSIVPGRALATVEFPAGRYGRGTGGPSQNCDETFQWDGRDENGREVPTGVYLLKLRTSSYQGIKRILFRGR